MKRPIGGSVVTALAVVAAGCGDGSTTAQESPQADPVAPNSKPDGTDNPRGRARNRRVEVVIPR